MTSAHWPQRLTALDVSRGVAALSVVLWHWQHFAYSGVSPASDFERSDQPLYAPLRLFYEHGDMGVDYFFILSGFIFHWLYGASVENRSVTAGRFVMQRFSRLYPLHFLTLLLVAGLQYAYSALTDVSFVYAHNDIGHFVLHLFFASNWWPSLGYSFNGPIWSVSIEVLLYAVFFVMAVRAKSGWPWALALSLLAFVAVQFLPVFLFRGMALYFMGGVVFHLATHVTDRARDLAPWVFGLACLSWSAVLVGVYLFDLSAWLTSLGVPMYRLVPVFTTYVLFPATVCAIALLDVSRGGFLKSIAWVGDITYSSYLIHFPLQLLFAFAVSFGLLGSGFWREPLYLVLFFALLIPGAWLTYRYFEMPAQRWLRKRLSFGARSPV
ncbi:MAG: acyltransferase family protein [Gammaproteobacteria bacterium]